jgi:chromosome segregation ATPase
MLKHLLNTTCPTSLMLWDGNDTGTSEAEAKAKLREAIAKGTKVEAKSELENQNATTEEETEEEGEQEEETEEETEADPVEETDEQKAAREAKEKEDEKLAAKSRRKDERIQKRIDDLTSAKKNLEAELAAIKAANPDNKLTEAEVQSKAEAIAAKKLADKELQEIQNAFNDACDKLQKEGKKLDKDFDTKINEMAEQFGPIPSFMIGVLEDLENGPEVLVYLANDDDEAERIYKLQNKTPKFTKELIDISNKLLAAKKPKPKPISKVPDGVKPVTGSRANNSLVITEADTKDMGRYVAKRAAQRDAQRKARGY